MTVAMYPSLLQLSDSRSLRAPWMVVISLGLHCALLAMIAGLRFAPKVERPLVTYQVSLVNLPAPARVTPTPLPAPVQSEPKPAPPVEEPPPPEPAPTPPMPKLVTPVPPPAQAAAVTQPPQVKATAPRAAPLTAAPPPREAPTAKTEPDNLLRDVFKGIELPPEAPKLGEITPPAPGAPPRLVETYKPDPAAQKLSNKIRDLKVPEVPVAPSTSKPVPAPPKQAESRPVVSPDLLEKLQRPTEQIRRPPEQRLAAARPATPLSAAPPTTAIQTSGAQGNPYWTLVQQRIDSKFVAPQVDFTARARQVIIRFRLDRTGNVSDVMVKQSSGNGYYDDAAKRAVLAADPLPPFPADITERHIMTDVTFKVGEQAG